MPLVDAEADSTITITTSTSGGMRAAASSDRTITLSTNTDGFRRRGSRSSRTITVTNLTRPHRKRHASAYASLEVFSRSRGTRKVSASADGQIIVNSSAFGNQGRSSLGVCDAVRAIFMVWGIEQPCKAPRAHQIEALNVLNSAMQQVWNHAKDRDYWTQTTETITLNSGVNSQVLDDSIQNVVGPGRIQSSRRTIVPMGTIGDFENFTDYFLDGETTGTPCAYYIERQCQNEDDPVMATFMVTPTPTVNTTFLLDVVKEAPRYQQRDVTNCPIIPIPHKYVESLLLPVVRYLSIRSYLYVERNPKSTEMIETEYLMAREGLDLADPLPDKTGANTNRREDPQV